MSRRRVLRVSALVASSAAAVTVAESAATAAPGQPSTGSRAELGRVSKTGDGTALLQVESPDTPHASRVADRELVPYAGFPDHVVPRVGDLVVVTDWAGKGLAAVPVCHWISGVPRRRPDGDFSIGDTVLAATPLLEHAGRKPIQVCVLDTELPTAQVLATRGG
jgi:hypothetical protein